MNSIGLNWKLTAICLIFSMQLGFLLLESGLCRKKNDISIALKNLLDFVFSFLIFWVFGYGIAFSSSTNGIIPLSFDKFAYGLNQQEQIYHMLMGAMFCSTCVTIISGAMAERAKLSTYIAIVAFVSFLIYPLMAHWVWNSGVADGVSGFLTDLGAIDNAGGVVVHATGGWIGLAASILLGPRYGRFTGNKRKSFYLANSQLAISGALILFMGWIGFNTAAISNNAEAIYQIVLNTIIAGCSGLVGGYILALILNEMKVSVLDYITSLLSGLVAVTSGVFEVTPIGALILGLFGGAVGLISKDILENFKIDDPVGSISVHLLPGITGAILLAFFQQDIFTQLVSQLNLVVVNALWAFVPCFLFLKLLKKLGPIRYTKEQETLGLNFSLFGVKSEVFDILEKIEDIKNDKDLDRKLDVDLFSSTSAYNLSVNLLIDKFVARDKENQELIKKLKAANVKLMEYDRTIAHDLKTPLAMIQACTDFIRENLDDEEEVKKQLDNITKSTRSSADTINGLLEHAKSENPGEGITKVDLEEVIIEVLGILEKSIDQVGGQVLTYLECTEVFWNKIIVKQVLANFLTNAVKYHSESRELEISIRTYEKDKYIVIEVEDNGIGIKDEEKQKVFQAFQRSDEVKNTKGHGVGLTNMKSAVESLDGKIDFSSTHDQGSKFQLLILKEEFQKKDQQAS